MAAVAMVVPADPPSAATPWMAPCAWSRARITVAPSAMAVTLRPRSLSFCSAARSSFAAAATSACEMSAAKGGLSSTPTSIIIVRSPAPSMRSRRKENSSPLVSKVPISAMVLGIVGIIALGFGQFACCEHPALLHGAQKSLGARRRIDGDHFQRLPTAIDGGVEDVGWNVNHISGAYGLPLLAVDIDHLLALPRNHVEDLLCSRVIVPYMAFSRLQEYDPHGEAFCGSDAGFAEPLDRSPVKHLGFHIGGSYEPAAGELRHACSFHCVPCGLGGS